MKEEKKSWDAVWGKVFTENEWGKYPSESLIRFIARNYYKANRPDVKILEVGCGPGANIWYLSKERFDAYGIDGSEAAIGIASKRLEQENLKAHLSVGDIVNLPYGNNFFDAVIDVECIYCNNTENSIKILTEIKRVLKPNGKFYSRTFSDQQFIGSQYKEVADNEYKDIIEGPLAGKGFVRLTPKDAIVPMYGSLFHIHSVDEMNYTQNNGEVRISEWVIISEKQQ